MYCFKAGTFCDGNRNCVLDKYSNRKPSTTRSIETRTPSKTARTLYPTRARTPFPTESRTRYPTFRTTRRFNDYTTRSSFRISHTSTLRWWYGVIIGGVVVTVAVIIAAVICSRRNSASNAPGHSGTGGMVLTAPAHIYGQSPGNNMPTQPLK
ncbi:uncharacterized protein LOC128554475 isoform X2 [Mercenaria mercenaria]|uniref:uncharacterized protein LOC128554475 isoform X2 n=1 Tax=Mercenaria mercenaria TaxID=6596 RepID=UPI00234F0CCE|nr:uncharacterized protein LOC128554475 isoform X2 [Mercenaria mercenaria]